MAPVAKPANTKPKNQDADAKKRKNQAARQRRQERRKERRQVFNQIQELFGLTDALLSMDKTDPKKGFTLKEAFEQIRNDKITDPARAAQILAKTNWFKTYGPEVTKRLVAEKTAQGTFKQGVAQAKSQIQDFLAQRGIQIDAKTLNTLARDAWVYGFNDSQILDQATKKEFTVTGGEVGGTLAALDSLAYANGIKLSEKDRTAWSRALASGSATQEQYEQHIREAAASRYAVFGDQIRAGQNLMDLTLGYRQIMSDLLELPDGDAIDWDDPLIRDGKAFMQPDDKGQLTLKPMWEFRKEVMSDPRWQYTDNARERYTQFGSEILRRFGMGG